VVNNASENTRISLVLRDSAQVLIKAWSLLV